MSIMDFFRTISCLYLFSLISLFTLNAQSIPDKALPHFNSGNKSLKEQHWEIAEEHFSQALRIHPYFAEALNNRGIARYHQKNFSGAMSDFLSALQLRPEWPTLFYNRANVKLIQGDFIGAEKDYTTTLSLNPKHTSAKFNKALTLYAQSNIPDAEKEVNELLQLSPNYSSAWVLSALVQLQQKNLSTAAEFYSKALSQDSLSLRTHFNQAHLSFFTGDYATAAKEFTVLIHKYPQDIGFRMHRGAALFLAGDSHKACEDWKFLHTSTEAQQLLKELCK